MHSFPLAAASRSLRAFRTAALASSSVLCLMLAGPSTALAADELIDGGASVAVRGDGSGDKPSPWHIYEDLYVGRVGVGALTISDGATVSNSAGSIGYNGGSTGTVTVTGAGSNWFNGWILRVGAFGSGTLTIADGGTVRSGSGINLASGTGSSGSVTVTGAGSNLTSTGDLGVGDRGTGTLTISGGATVRSKVAYIGSFSDGSGSVEISDAGSSWVNDAELFVGRAGTGTVRVSGGAAASSLLGFFGYEAGSSGTFEVTGAGSSWVTSGLRVGIDGTGALTVSDGGVIASSGASIGEKTGGVGAVRVTGAESRWRSWGIISIGRQGQGSLTIEQDALVTAWNVDLVESSTGVGNLTLKTGGVLETGLIRSGSGNATATFDGGVLRLTGTQGDLFDGLSVSVLAGGATIDTPAVDVATSASLNGSGGLTKLGSGTLTLTGVNSLTGRTIVAEGTLRAGSATGLSAGSVYDIASGAALNLNGFNSTIGGLTGSGAVNLDGGTILTVAQNSNSIYGGTISGSGSFNKQGAGGLMLTAANSYTGGTVVEGGALRAGSATAFVQNGSYTVNGGTLDLNGHALTMSSLSGSGGAVALGSASLTVAQNSNSIYGGTISGTGSFTKQGSGALTLSGTSSYTGGTVVAGGALRAGSATALRQDGSYTISGGTLDLNGHALTMSALTGSGGTVALNGAHLTIAPKASTSYAGTLTGAGYLIKQGSGTLTLTGSGTLTGGMQIESGSLEITGGSLALSSALTLRGKTMQASYLRISGGGTLSSADGYIDSAVYTPTWAEISDAGSSWSYENEVIVGGLGYGVLAVTSGATASGQTAVIGQLASATGDAVVATAGSRWDNSGYIVVGDEGKGGLLITTKATASTPTVILGRSTGGSGNLTLASGGVLETSQVSGGAGRGSVNLDGGIVRLTGAQSDLFSGLSVFVLSGGATIDTQAFTVATATAFTGSGSFTKQGSGTLTLTGASTHTGDTVVEAGTLMVGVGGSGTIGGSVTVETGGRLGGSGLIGGDVAVANGGVLAPGNSPGTLSISGDLSLASGSVLAFELGQANTVGGGLNDHIVVGGDLVLDGTLDVSVSTGGTFGAGVYRLISYGGTLTDNGLTLGTMPTGSAVNLQTAVRGQVNLVNTAGLTLRYWDGTTGLNNGAVEGGSGLWRAGVSSGWTEADGMLNGGYTDGSFAVFGGRGGTVTLDASHGALHASGLQFLSDGYVLTGDALTLTGPVSTVRVGDGTAAGAGMTATIHSALIGSSQLVKADLGTLILTGANSYSGGTVVEAGTLRAGSANAFVQNSSYTVNGGTLDLSGHALTVSALSGSGGTVALGAASLTVAQAANTVYAGRLTGSGSLTKQGSGTLTLTGANSYSGGTVVESGTLRAGSVSAFVQHSSYTVNGGTLDLSGHALTVSALSGTGGTVALGGASLTVAQAADTVYSGTITGAGDLVKQGSGTLVLAGANTYTGGTVVEGGTLRAGSATAFAQNGTYVLNGGTLDLSGHALTITALSGSGGGIALGGASLTLALAGDTTFAGNLTGAGALIKQGGGTLFFSGDNSGFAGTVRLADGHMVVGQGGGATLGGTVELAAGGRLSGSGTVGSTVVGDQAVLAPGNSIGTLTVNGDLTLGAGSLYEVEVDPTASASDRVHVTGKARLEGGTVLHLGEDGDYQPFARYTILTADGGIEGTFGTVRSQFAFLTPTLSYTDHDVSLELMRNTAGFSDGAASGNQRATAAAAERLGAGHAVYDAILLLPDDAARVQHSFDLLSGEVHASARSVLIEDSRFVREAVSQQLRGGPGGGLWAQTFGGWGRRSGDGNAARLTHNTKGFLLGWDVALGDGSAGLVAGYGNADLSVGQRASSAEAESYHLGLYWGTRLNSLSLRGGAAYSWHDLETRRDATVAALSQNLRADYKATSVQAFAEAAWSVNLGKITLEPTASLAHVINTVGDFAETGGTAALLGRSGALAVTFGTLGVNARLGFSLGNLPAAVHGSFGWQHAFGDTTPASRHAFSNGALFTVAGSPLAQDVARLQTGFQLDVSKRASLGLGYSGQYAGGVEKHDLSARFAVRF